MLSVLFAKENPIKYSDSNSKTDKTISMLSLRRTGLHIIYSIALLFLVFSPEKLLGTFSIYHVDDVGLYIPHTNEIFYVLSASANYSLCVLSVLSTMENLIKLVEYSDFHSKIDKTTIIKALSSPLYLLFNTNLFLYFLRCFTRVSRSVSSNCLVYSESVNAK